MSGINQGCRNYPESREPSPFSWHQKSDGAQFPYGGSKSIRCPSTELVGTATLHLGFLEPWFVFIDLILLNDHYFISTEK